jgi:transposase InsO family protein
MSSLYDISGITRQGFHKASHKQKEDQMLLQRLKEMVIEIRKDYPGMSARKIHYMFGIEQIGINRFERFVSQQGLGVKKYRSFMRTTYAGAVWYENLVNGISLSNINCMWASDITYFKPAEQTYYIVLILDVYSRRIIGHSASDNMMAVNNKKALTMAMKTRRQKHFDGLIHHSDKGSQYSSKEYTKMLTEAHIEISMAESCLENAYAERIIGTIKNDYLRFENIKTLDQLHKSLARAVKLYNACPHNELGYLSPLAFESYIASLRAEHRPLMQLYDFRKPATEQNPRDSEMGFKRHKTMKIAIDKKTVALLNKTTVRHFPGSGYSSEGCPPAEPSSASPDQTKLNQLNQLNKLNYQQLE